MLDIKEEELKTILPLDGPSTEEVKKYLEKYNDEYIVIKCGGSVLIDQNLFDIFIKDISTLNKLGFTPIIVHGGGKRISNKLNEIGLESKFIKGLRVTDKETIKVVEEVLIDFNKEIINALDQKNCKSQSINSKENNILTVVQENEELGFVGSPTNVDQSIIDKIIADKKVPIIAPLGLDKNDQTYNVNADTAAGYIAKKINARRLIILSDVEGVLDKNKNSHLFKTKLFEKEIENPIGMAAGFDKNAEVYNSLFKLGFGFVEVGTVTPLKQYGNPKPRVFRLVEDEALINRLGFNNLGAKNIVDRISSNKQIGLLGINIGPNKDTNDRLKDYVECLKTFHEFADYITINISSPNTEELRNFHDQEKLNSLLNIINSEKTKLNSKIPIVVKVSPDIKDKEIPKISDVLLSNNIKAVILSNTSDSTRDKLNDIQKHQKGGLSGKPIEEKSTMLINKFYKAKENNDIECIVWGSGKPTRELMFVDDLVSAIEVIIESNPIEEIINVGSGSEISIKDLANKISFITGYKGKVVFDTSKPDGVLRKTLDSSLISSLNWSPKVDLDDGLKRTYEWYKKNK